MKKFKIGDKVIIVDRERWGSEYIGLTTRITALRDDYFDYEVAHPTSTRYMWGGIGIKEYEVSPTKPVVARLFL